MSEIYEPPADNPETKAYWDGTREKKLMLQVCATTGKYQYPPRAASIHDLGAPVEWKQAAGTGTVYAASVHYVPGNKFMRDKVPYVVALIELDEGVRVMSNVINCPPDDVHVGMKVTVTWQPLPDGRALPMFEPA